MQGSLIFVVIVAVWAAYLVQHWVHRREDAAATRSVDGFSAAMRVLQRRPFRRGAEGGEGSDLVEPRADSSPDHLTPDGRASLQANRSQPSGASRAGSPLTARSSRTGSTAIAAIAASTVIAISTVSTLPTQSDPVKVEPMPQTRRPNRTPDEQHRPTGPSTRTAAGTARGTSMGHRRLRAALLLVALLWVPTSIGLAATNVLTWLSVPFAVLTVAAVLVWLRTEVMAERARSVTTDEAGVDGLFQPAEDDTQAVHTHGYAAAPGVAEGRTAHEVATPAATAQAGAAPVVATAGSGQGPAARRQAAAFFDGQADTTVVSRVSASTAADQAADQALTAQAEPLAAGTWSPVPVPRPTYSLKAKAEPRLTESGIPADVFATPEFADEADELDARALFARRAASG